MAELTTIEEKLAEVLGLAQAAQDATQKVEGLVEDRAAEVLQRMREEAKETEDRCTQLAAEEDPTRAHDARGDPTRRDGTGRTPIACESRWRSPELEASRRSRPR